MARESPPSPVHREGISDIPTGLGAVGIKFLSSRFSATGKPCLESVVTWSRRWWRAGVPWSRLRRSTRSWPAEPPPCPSLPSLPSLAHPARAAVGAFAFGREGSDQNPPLAVTPALAIRRPTTLPGPLATEPTSRTAHLSARANAFPCSAIPATFTEPPLRSPPSLFSGFRSPACDGDFRLAAWSVPSRPA